MENIPFFLSVYHSTMSSSKPAYADYFGRIGGMPLYKKFIQHWREVEKFEARPDDLVIVTYPKSGKSFCYVKFVPFSPRKDKSTFSVKYWAIHSSHIHSLY